LNKNFLNLVWVALDILAVIVVTGLCSLTGRNNVQLAMLIMCILMFIIKFGVDYSHAVFRENEK